MLPKEAACRKKGLHEWRDEGSSRTHAAERCRKCGVKAVWTLGPKGGADNAKYLRAHAGTFAQPFGRNWRVFVLAHGREAFDRALRKKAEGDDWETVMADARKRLAELRAERTV